MKRLIGIYTLFFAIIALNLFLVNGARAATIAVTPGSARVGEAVTVQGSFSAAAQSARIDFGDGTRSSCFTSTPFSTTHKYRSAGDYTVTVTEYRAGSGPCVAAWATVTDSVSIYDLLISRVGLAFPDGRGEASVEKDGELRLTATIRYSGAGVLRGRWEVDDVPVGVFNQPLFAGKNGGSITLESPLLPTFDAGSHDIRLVITYPAPSFDLPVLRYFVLPRGAEQPPQTGPSSSKGYPVVASLSGSVPPPSWQVSKSRRVSIVYENDIHRSPDTVQPYGTYDKQAWVQFDFAVEGTRNMDTLRLEISPRYFNMDEKGEGQDHLWNLPRFYMSYSHEGWRWNSMLEAGDLSVDESPYTASGLDRRGLGAGIGLFGRVRFRAYSVRTTDTVAVSDGLGTGEKDFRLDGGSLSIDVLKDGLFTIKTIYIKGRLGDQDFYNTATGEPPVKGNTKGLVLISYYPNIGISSEIEFAKSDFDSDTTDSAPSKKDEAKRFTLSFSGESINIGGEAFRIGKDFRSIGSLDAPWDQEGYSLTGGISRDTFSLTVSFSDSRDNVEKESYRSRIATRTGGADLYYTSLPWATFGLSYSRTLQDSRFDPLDSIPVDNTTDTYGASIDLSSQNKSIGISGSVSRFNDRGEFNLDWRSYDLTVTGSYDREGLLSLNPSFQFTRYSDIYTDVRTDNQLFALEGSLAIIPDILILDFRGTADINKATDDSVKDRTYNLFTRLAFNIGRFIPGVNGPQFLSLKYDYTDADDDVTPSNDRVEKVIFVAFEGGMGF